MLNEIEYTDATPSLSQAQRLREFSKQGSLNADVIYAVMRTEKQIRRNRYAFLVPHRGEIVLRFNNWYFVELFEPPYPVRVVS